MVEAGGTENALAVLRRRRPEGHRGRHRRGPRGREDLDPRVDRAAARARASRPARKRRSSSSLFVDYGEDVYERVVAVGAERLRGGERHHDQGRAQRRPRRGDRRDRRRARRRVPRARARDPRGGPLPTRRRSSASASSKRASASTDAARPTSGRSRPRSASSRPRTARRCSSAATPRC